MGAVHEGRNREPHIPFLVPLPEELLLQLIGPPSVCARAGCQVADVSTLQHHLHTYTGFRLCSIQTDTGLLSCRQTTPVSTLQHHLHRHRLQTVQHTDRHGLVSHRQVANVSTLQHHLHTSTGFRLCSIQTGKELGHIARWLVSAHFSTICTMLQLQAVQHTDRQRAGAHCQGTDVSSLSTTFQHHLCSATGFRRCTTQTNSAVILSGDPCRHASAVCPHTQYAEVLVNTEGKSLLLGTEGSRSYLSIEEHRTSSLSSGKEGYTAQSLSTCTVPIWSFQHMFTKLRARLCCVRYPMCLVLHVFGTACVWYRMCCVLHVSVQSFMTRPKPWAVCLYLVH